MQMKASTAFPTCSVALSGDFNSGPAGPQGPAGPRGPAGADGYTPVKGTDYWTAADREDILAEVQGMTYTREELDAALGAYITDIDALIGGDA